MVVNSRQVHFFFCGVPKLFVSDFISITTYFSHFAMSKNQGRTKRCKQIFPVVPSMLYSQSLFLRFALASNRLWPTYHAAAGVLTFQRGVVLLVTIWNSKIVEFKREFVIFGSI